MFGNLSEDVDDLRHAHTFSGLSLDPLLSGVFATIKAGTFGDPDQFSALVNSIVDHGDYYLVSDDFKSYVDTQKLIDESYRDQEGWLTKTITAVSRMGFFSSDRCIEEVSRSSLGLLGTPQRSPVPAEIGTFANDSCAAPLVRRTNLEQRGKPPFSAGSWCPR